MLGGTLALVLLIAVAIALVVVLTRRTPPPPSAGFPPPPSVPGPDTGALRILQQRFASGEIDQDEFRARAETLRELGG
jgi:hypothetical protein